MMQTARKIMQVSSEANGMPIPTDRRVPTSSLGATLIRVAALMLVATGAASALAGCSKPEQLTGNYTATCTFKGSYRGGGRADNSWTRQCTLTLEPRNETEIAMRLDTGDSIECFGHAMQTGSTGERKLAFAKNDLTCRAKTLPAPPGVRVEQCPMPATFEISELPEKNKKPNLGLKVSVEVADKRACVFSYLEKVAFEAKLAPGGKPVTIEAFLEVDAGPVPPLPSHEALPAFAPPAVTDGGAAAHADAAAHAHAPNDAGPPAKDASTK